MDSRTIEEIRLERLKRNVMDSIDYLERDLARMNKEGFSFTAIMAIQTEIQRKKDIYADIQKYPSKFI